MSKGPMHALARFIRKVAFADAVGVSDAQLLHAYVLSGDQDAFAALVKRHGPMVLGVCSRLLRNTSDAEDAFQATFLVLVRKARRIVRPKLLANWLYGVARRTALRARAKAACRAHYEMEAAAMRDNESAGADQALATLWSDLRPILDEEIAHLPERLRVPVILCYLEGRTNEEAAKIIGCPKGTVVSRLATARERLRKRLTRRGLAPRAALLSATLTGSTLRAAVPPALVQTSVRAALAFAAGAPTASVTATILAKGVIANMFWTKTFHAVALISALALAGSAGVWAWAMASSNQDDSQPVVGAAQDFRPAHDVGAAPASKRSPKVDANASLPNDRGSDEQDSNNGQDKQPKAPQPQSQPNKDDKGDIKTVDVVEVKEQMVTDYAYYNGRTEAAVSVDLRARVSGYLVKVLVKEGADVKKGDVLFEIDPRVYEAEAQRADALLAQADARLQRAEGDFKRFEALYSARSVSQEVVEKAKGERAEAQSALQVALAGRQIARLNLSFTKLSAPIDGTIGRLPLSEGALVKADETVLGNIVSRNPVLVTFNIDEATAVQLQRQFVAVKSKIRDWKSLPVAMGLVNDKDYPRIGKIESADIRVDPNTGTLRLRAVFPNSDGLILPGMFCKVRLSVSEPYRVVTIPENALSPGLTLGKQRRKPADSDEFVLVVNKDGAVERRKIVFDVGQGNLVDVKKGVKPGEWVVVDPRPSRNLPSDLESIRSGMIVKPRRIDPSKEPAQ